MDGFFASDALAQCVAAGALGGFVLMVALCQVKGLIRLWTAAIADEFADVAYWICAVFGGVALYLGIVRHNSTPGILVTGSFYFGLTLPFVSGWGLARLRLIRALQARLLSHGLLAHIAIAMWACSLALPVSVAEAGKDQTIGATLLAIGWIGPFIAQFAWYANLLLLTSFWHLLADRSVTLRMLSALLLSLNTFTSIWTPGGSGKEYGLGWGFFLWFMSLALMLSASGAAAVQDGRRPTLANGGWARPVGMALCVLIGVWAVTFSVHDHLLGNRAEQGRMAGVAVKQGAVCKVELSNVSRPLVNASGPVEVRDTSVPQRSEYAPALRGLADWGIPKLRFDGRDYFYQADSNGQLLVSVPAAGNAIATLELSAIPNAFDLRLLAADGHLIVHQHWDRIGRTDTYCPDFSRASTVGAQPRELVMQGLGLSVTAPIRPGVTEQDRSRAFGLIIEPPHPVTTATQTPLDSSCPSGVGWMKNKPAPGIVSTSRRNGFAVGSQVYYPGGTYQSRALCQGDYIYLYSDSVNNDLHVLTLEKRRLADFSLAGGSTLQFQVPNLSKSGLGIERVIETAGGYSVELVDLPAAKRLKVEASLRLGPGI